MRTTLDIPDAVGRLAKIRAAQSGESLKVLFTRALERELAVPSCRPSRKTRPALPVIRSRTPGALKLTPDELSAVLVREEDMAYEAALRR